MFASSFPNVLKFEDIKTSFIVQGFPFEKKVQRASISQPVPQNLSRPFVNLSGYVR